MVVGSASRTPQQMGISFDPMEVGVSPRTITAGFNRFGLCGLLSAVLVGANLIGCTPVEKQETDSTTEVVEAETMSNENTLATATFASGCYWCTEAVFQRLEGVENVVSGAMGGHVENPSYRDLCAGTTGHAECIQFNYDPAKVNYETLLEVFWKTHDPTTLNMQGADVGPQYRSAVFYHTEEQRALAEKYKAKLNEAGVFANPIVTEITAASEFYAAKADHQNFYNENPNYGYCSYVIRPKIEKLEAVFSDKLKSK